MEERFKNWRTTGIGIFILIAGITGRFLDQINVVDMISLILLSWVFLTAKDTLLEGITAGWFKLNK